MFCQSISVEFDKMYWSWLRWKWSPSPCHRLEQGANPLVRPQRLSG